jgi:hypothetical protein
MVEVEVRWAIARAQCARMDCSVEQRNGCGMGDRKRSALIFIANNKYELPP